MMKKFFLYKYKINDIFLDYTKYTNNIDLNNIFLNEKSNKCYLRFKSFEDLDFGELNHVLKYNKTNELCDSALTNHKINKEYLTKKFNLLHPKENFNFNIIEKEQIINKQINKYNWTKIKMRKTENQIKILEREFKINPFWNKLKINEIAQESGLSIKKIYNWKWSNQNIHL